MANLHLHPLAYTQPQADFLNDLRNNLTNIQNIDCLTKKLTLLRPMLDQCYTSPALSNTTSFDEPHAGMLSLVEKALDDVVREFQARLGQPWKNLHSINAASLYANAQDLMKDPRIQACVEDLAAMRSMEMDVRDFGDVFEVLRAHALSLPEAEEELGEGVRPWLFEFTLFVVMEMARLISIRFANWEVKLLNQVVPGTGMKAVCERLPVDADVLQQIVNAGGAVEDGEVKEDKKAKPGPTQNLMTGLRDRGKKLKKSVSQGLKRLRPGGKEKKKEKKEKKGKREGKGKGKITKEDIGRHYPKEDPQTNYI